jgi:hypothetical protein
VTTRLPLASHRLASMFGASSPPVFFGVVSCFLRADCHGAIYETWEHSPMHRMTRLAQGDAIEASFDGTTLQVGGDTATMEMRDGKRYVDLVSTEDGRHLYRVTKVIGGRYWA